MAVRMSVTQPYRRTCRPFVDGSYTGAGRSGYILHPRFAQSPEHYVRAFLILLKDLQELFDYIELSDNNLGCYSYRIHALLLRACVEVEANCKAILTENGYARGGDWNMNDYKKIDKTHLLSAYEVKVPHWSGTRSIRAPFAAWASGGSLPWYQAYNTTKHDRHSQFDQATFDHYSMHAVAYWSCCPHNLKRTTSRPKTPWYLLGGHATEPKPELAATFECVFSRPFRPICDTTSTGSG